ncbi:hypothetical protein J3Q64DRAFT_1752236 [Phycomyces blakesleeanus]|uniref:HAP1 N-terminal domain-containing protein n=1 Tax=Phycomyces blakesleeanus TaxID=4837 RepID=A0ABR3AWM6_PHYBL
MLGTSKRPAPLSPVGMCAAIDADTEPASPVLSTSSFMSSISWVAEKSAADLVALLKNAYSAMKEKEKDLLLAAEIGKSLLENNMALKSKYEHLLEQAQAYHAENEAEMLEQISMASRFDDDNDDDDMRFITTQNARKTLIETLERKNKEMEQMLERALHKSNEMDEANEAKSEELEQEIERLRESLDQAAVKVQELESATRHAKLNGEQRMTERATSEGVRHYDQDDSVIAVELAEKLARLETENAAISFAKNAIKQRLTSALHDLNHLRQQFDSFEFTQQGYQDLQEGYQRQFTHIAELNESLEDHRHVLSKLRDRGQWSGKHTPTPSEHPGGSLVKASLLERNTSLLGELQSTWSKGMGDLPILTDPDLPSPPSSSCSLANLQSFATLAERNLTSFYNAPAAYTLETALSSVGINDRGAIDEAMRFLEYDSQDGLSDQEDNMLVPYDGSPTTGLYPDLPNAENLCRDLAIPQESLGVSGRIAHLVRCLFKAVLRWCRFSIILTTAVMINLWQGPEGFLEI